MREMGSLPAGRSHLILTVDCAIVHVQGSQLA